MQVLFLNDRDFRDFESSEVTSSAFFNKAGVEDPNGIFSPSIFGETPEDKEKRTGFR